MHSLHSTRHFVHGFLILAAFLFLAAPLLATPLLDVYLPDRTSHHELVSGQFDIVEMTSRSAAVVGWPEDVEKLNRLGLVYETRIPDMETFYRDRLDSDLDDMGGYATLSEIYTWMHFMATSYPDLVSGPDTVGYTHEERPILVLKLSDNPDEDEDEPEVFINSAIHAREVITPLIIENFVELILSGYGTDDRATSVLDNHEIWIMPSVNPDGYAYNEENQPNGGGMWRKNKYRENGTLYGVDVNRNFPYMWGNDDTGSSPDPTDETFRGPSAGSEPETQAIMNFINSRQFEAVLNYHSYSNLILVPYGYTYDRPPNFDVYMAYGEYMNETLGWEVGGPEVIYTTNGDAQDWQEEGADYHMWNFTFEVGTREDGFWPSLSRRDVLVPQQVEPLYRFVEVAPNPFLLLPPPAPVLTLAGQNGGEYTLSWLPAADDHGNVAVEYDIAQMQGISDIADAENADASDWNFDGFSRLLMAGPDEGDYSYYSGDEPATISTMTAMYAFTVQEGDTLTFDTKYVIEVEYDYAYVQASINGGPYINLAGDITTDDNPNGANQGNGITGAHSTWGTAHFPLDDYVGDQIQLRFAYVTDTWVNEGGFYVDNVQPFVAFQSFELFAEAVTDTFLAISQTELTDTTHFWYMGRSIDERGDMSGWGATLPVTVEGETNVGDELSTNLPQDFAVEPLYPNPFNPTAAVQVALPVRSTVTLRVVDVLGRQVQELYYGQKAAGHTSLTLNGTNWATGIYFVVVEMQGVDGRNFRNIQKAVLVK